MMVMMMGWLLFCAPRMEAMTMMMGERKVDNSGKVERGDGYFFLSFFRCVHVCFWVGGGCGGGIKRRIIIFSGE